MDLLIDTHVFIWFDSRLPRLPRDLDSLLRNRSNRVWVSTASVWEIAIKRRRGKLPFSKPGTEAVGRHGFEALSIPSEDAERAGDLAWSHADPFDRMIVAQAQRRGFTLVSGDGAIAAFPGAVSLMKA